MTSRHARMAIVTACRKLMQAGRLRPTMRACCAPAGRSVSTGHRAFGPVASPQRAAIDDIATQHAILRRILGAERRARRLNAGRRMVTNAVLGRIGNIAKAAFYERRLAEIEAHAPKAWAVEAPAGGSTP